MEKNHFRKVFKSDHLGVADLEEFIEEKRPLIFTVKYVKQELGVSVAGKKGDHNIAYFVEPIKPLVLNATNSKIMQSFHPDKSPFVEDWQNVTIELYIDSTVKMKGSVVGGVRIKPTRPVMKDDIEMRVSKAMTNADLTSLYNSLSKDQQNTYKDSFSRRKQQINQPQNA